MNTELNQVVVRAHRLTSLLYAVELCLDHSHIRLGPDLDEPTVEARKALFGSLHAAQTYADELRERVAAIEAEVEREERAEDEAKAAEIADILHSTALAQLRVMAEVVAAARTAGHDPREALKDIGYDEQSIDRVTEIAEVILKFNAESAPEATPAESCEE